MKFKIGSEVRHILTGTKYLVVGDKNTPYTLLGGSEIKTEEIHDYLLLELDGPVEMKIISEFEASIELWETVS